MVHTLTIVEPIWPMLQNIKNSVLYIVIQTIIMIFIIIDVETCYVQDICVLYRHIIMWSIIFIIVCGWALSSDSVEVTAVSFVIPVLQNSSSALNPTSSQAGALDSIIFLGMMVCICDCMLMYLSVCLSHCLSLCLTLCVCIQCLCNERKQFKGDLLNLYSMQLGSKFFLLAYNTYTCTCI